MATIVPASSTDVRRPGRCTPPKLSCSAVSTAPQTDPDARVEVRRAQPRRQPRQRGVLLRRRLARTQQPDRRRAVLGDDRRQLGAGVAQHDRRLGVEAVLAAAQPPGEQPLPVSDLVVAEAAAHADLVARDVVARRRPHDHAAAVPHADLDRAAHAALGADGAHPALRAGQPLVGRLHQRGRGADVDAGAAEVAVRFIDRAARPEGHAGREAAPGQRDRGRVAQVVAGPLAARAEDAHLRVELEIGVAAVGRGLLVLVVGARLVEVRLDVGAPHVGHVRRRLQFAAVVLRAGHAAVRDDVVAQADVSRAAVLHAVAGQAAVAVVGQDEGHHLLAHLQRGRAVGAHDHPLAHLRAAGQHLPAHPLDLDDASAAARVGRQPVDVAEVGDVDARVLDDLHQGTAGLDLVGRAVDRDLDRRAGDHPASALLVPWTTGYGA